MLGIILDQKEAGRRFGRSTLVTAIHFASRSSAYYAESQEHSGQNHSQPTSPSRCPGLSSLLVAQTASSLTIYGVVRWTAPGVTFGRSLKSGLKRQCRDGTPRPGRL